MQNGIIKKEIIGYYILRTKSNIKITAQFEERTLKNDNKNCH